MRFDIMTLFPASLDAMMQESILGRAKRKGLIEIHAHQIRDYTTNRQNQVDDYPYGGGRGAILQCDPLYNCWTAICDEIGAPVYTIFLSPCGAVFDQEKARQLRDSCENIILVCGHYERVPEVLLSGNHAMVDRWRKKQAILRTMRCRPDMFGKLRFPYKTRAEKKFIAELEAEDAQFRDRDPKNLDRSK